MRILLVSSSARGHAIAETLARSPQHPDIFSLCTTRNPGIRGIAVAQEVLDIMDFPAVLAHAKRWQPDFAIIGPDDPIGGGLADLLEEEGIPCIAPRKNLAQIESSKGFARELLQKYGMDASPKFRIFSSRPLTLTLSRGERETRRFMADDLHGEYVVKYDGLKGGKGVKVSGEHLASVEEGVHYAQKCIDTCGQVVIEEKLQGVEFSLMSFVSGTQIVHMPAVQDHKRAYDGDTGPNTGGMGSYSMPDHSLPFLSRADLERAKEINQLVAEALSREFVAPPGEGTYKGILYGGYMVTADGIRVIEFNARFGDPEALNVLPLLEFDFVTICQAIISGELTEDLVRFAHKATVCKYIVPKSYPEGKEEKGMAFSLPSPLPPNVRLYFGDVSLCHGEKDMTQCDTLFLGTSRAVGMVGIGNTIEEAENIAQHLCEQVKGPIRFRSDIGTQIPYHMSFSR